MSTLGEQNSKNGGIIGAMDNDGKCRKTEGFSPGSVKGLNVA